MNKKEMKFAFEVYWTKSTEQFIKIYSLCKKYAFYHDHTHDNQHKDKPTEHDLTGY